MPLGIPSATHGVLWPLRCPSFAQPVSAACVRPVCAVSVVRVCLCDLLCVNVWRVLVAGRERARQTYLIPIVRVCVYVCLNVFVGVLKF